MTVRPPHIISWVARYAIPQESRVRAMLRRAGVPEADVDDLVQEAYCRLAALRSVDHIDNPAGYFVQMVKNAWWDNLRRAKIVPPDSFTENAALFVRDEATGIEAAAIAREELARIDTHDGAVPWLDVETPVVRAAGRVDVAAADHHGYFDACGPAFVRTLDADAYIVQAWHATHPAMATLQRMEGDWGSGSVLRDVFVTRLVAESRAVNARFLPGLRSSEGHVVVRVTPGGAYRVFVTDSRAEKDRMTYVGPRRRSKHIDRRPK